MDRDFFRSVLFFILLAFGISAPSIAVERVQVVVDKPLAPTESIPQVEMAAEQTPPPPLELSLEALQQDHDLTERLLNAALYQNQPQQIHQLLVIYRTFSNQDPILPLFAEARLATARGDLSEAIRLYRHILALHPELNPVRIALAQVLFFDQQNDNAKMQFEKAQSAVDLPPDAEKLIASYLNALQKRSGWQSRITLNYERDKNVNNASSQRIIDNPYLKGLRKNDSMMPQSAHGVAYGFSLARDVNLRDAHYIALENELFGKLYWDKHEFDDVYNRTSLGYRHKRALQTWSLMPFYEKRSYGNQSYQWGNGVRAEYQRWLSSHVQLSSAFEYTKQRYYDSGYLNGRNKQFSATLFWQRNPQQYVYFGGDYHLSSAQRQQYAYKQPTVRVGWGQEWGLGISSRLAFSFAKRQYQDQAAIAGIPLGAVRQDKIYHANLTLWKRDWHLWGITPKVQLRWKKQDSNLPSLYSYSNKQVNLLFEKSF